MLALSVRCRGPLRAPCRQALHIIRLVTPDGQTPGPTASTLSSKDTRSKSRILPLISSVVDLAAAQLLQSADVVCTENFIHVDEVTASPKLVQLKHGALPHQFRPRNNRHESLRLCMKIIENTLFLPRSRGFLPLITVWLEVRVLPGPPPQN